jgi:tRNA threonylcarbamoyladenosine biosynthesis protein TsaB
VKLLAVDTALGACSAAVIEDKRVLAHRHQLMDRGHAEALAPMVEETMRDAGIAFSDLGRLAVTTGPGTFTGQRVGLAFMRGLRIALHLPLAGITTLAAMAEAAKAETGLTRAIALHDARRDEVYLEIGDALPPCVMLFDEAIDVLRNLPADEPIAVAGTAASRVCDALAKRFILSSVLQPDALWVARLAMKMEAANHPPRPLYLRAPDAKLPAART